MVLLSYGNDLALETPITTSASSEEYGEEDRNPELSASPGSLFSREHMQTQVLRENEEKLLSLMDRDESSATRWLIHSCNFLTLTCLKGQLMEKGQPGNIPIKVDYVVIRYFPNHKTYSSTEKRLSKNMRGLLLDVLELCKDTVCTNPLTHYKTGRNRNV